MSLDGEGHELPCSRHPHQHPQAAITSDADTSYNFGDVLPINWQLRPHDNNGRDTSIECPEAWRILITFAISSLVVTLFSVVLVHRGVVRLLTLGIMGRIYDRRPSTFAKIKFAIQFFLPVRLQVGGNAIAVAMIFSTPGYESSVWNAATFFFLFAARPRHCWIALAFLARKRLTSWFPDEYPWRIAAATNAFSEFVMQFLGLFTLGGIAHFGDERGFGKVWSGEHSHLPASAKLLYAGAFLYVVMGVFGMIPLAITWSSIFVDFLRNDALIADTVKNMGHRENLSDRRYIGLLSLGCLFCTWRGSWLLWVGYVQLTDPGDKFCPPKLAEQGVIWTISGLLSSFFGAGA